MSQLSGGRFPGDPYDHPVTHSNLVSVVTDRWHVMPSVSGQVEVSAWWDDREEFRASSDTPAGRAALEDARRWLPNAAPTVAIRRPHDARYVQG